MRFEGSAGRFPAGLDGKPEGGVRVARGLGLRVRRKGVIITERERLGGRSGGRPGVWGLLIWKPLLDTL